MNSAHMIVLGFRCLTQFTHIHRAHHDTVQQNTKYNSLSTHIRYKLKKKPKRYRIKLKQKKNWIKTKSN